MAVWDKFKGNPIEKMTVRDLRTEELRLRNRVDRIRREIEKNEKEKTKLFQKGVGANSIKKKMLSQDITALDMESKLKLKSFTTARRQMTFTTNLLTIKNYEKELKNTDTWKKIVSIPPDQLEGYLIKLRLEGKDFDDVLTQLNQPFEMEVAEMEGEEMADGEKKLWDTWNKVEAGSMDATDAESTFSIESQLGEEDEEV